MYHCPLLHVHPAFEQWSGQFELKPVLPKLYFHIGNPLQYSCLENPMDRGAWWAVVRGVAKSWTRLSDLTFTFHFHALEKEMATHSSVLAWRIPGMGEPGGLPSMGSHRVGYDWSDLAAAAAVTCGNYCCVTEEEDSCPGSYGCPVPSRPYTGEEELPALRSTRRAALHVQGLHAKLCLTLE